MKLLDRMYNAKINRRDFLKGSAAATAALAGLSLAGCGENTITTTEEQTTVEPTTSAQVLPPEHVIPEDVEKQGKWVAAACWHNCGGRCSNKVLVVDGVVVRQKTDDTHEDTLDYPQQRSCLRGRSQRKQCFAADRVKYPMKRKNWSLENPNGQLRGKDEWERISWDEAMTYVADALKTTVAKYGPESVLNSDINMHTNEIIKAVNKYSGSVGCWSTWSWGAFTLGQLFLGQGSYSNSNDRYDMKNSDTIVMIGTNPAWSTTMMHRFKTHIRKDAKVILIDPFYNDAAALLNAEWLPIRPATDTAMMAGVLYAMLQKDEEKKLIDWEFLNNCTCGFDAEHLPEGADPKENLKDYLLGTYDGVPKTPAWAEEICGISAARLEQLAEEIGKDHNVAIYSGLAPARSSNTDSYPQMLIAFGAAGGHFGKPGNVCSILVGAPFQSSLATVLPGAAGLPAVANPVTKRIPARQYAQAILTGEYDDVGDPAMGFAPKPVEKSTVDIHMSFHVGESNGLQTRENIVESIEALRTLDCVVAAGYFMNAGCKYADIVLPIQHHWEWVNADVQSGNYEALIVNSQVTEPLYEAKHDQEIGAMLATKLGLDPAEIWPISLKQQYFNCLATSTYMTEDGSYAPICTITEEDIKNWGVEGAPQQGAVALEELRERGIFQIQRKEGDNLGIIQWETFRNDPVNNPLPTSSGKFEIYSQLYGDMINAFGWSKKSHIGEYVPAIEGYEDTFADWKNKVKGEYPYQLFTPHYLRRVHTNFDNVTWLREACENPLFINAEDAAREGIATGDTVLITSKRAKVLRHAVVSQRMMPGTIALPHGAWIDIDEETGIDHGGSDNALGGVPISGQGISCYNSILCKIEKYAGEPLAKDVDRPLMIFED